MTFDTGCEYTTVTSDICSNCSSKAYQPATSETENNLATQWELDMDLGGQSVELRVFAFTDTICLSDASDATCIDNFKFYPIYEQKNLPKGSDGIVGIAPLQTQKKKDKEGPSFVHALKRAGIIDRALVGLFVSKFEDINHTIQVGDFDPTVVEGGETGIQWFSLAVADLTWKWQTDLTKAHLGTKSLFKHDFKFVELAAGYEGTGLSSDDFTAASNILEAAHPNGIVCDGKKCLMKESCENYKGKMPDLKLTVSNRITYTIEGDDLLKEIKAGADKTFCQILLYNSGDTYRLGSSFLKNYYSVYDLDNFKMGLGKVKDLTPVDTSE